MFKNNTLFQGEIIWKFGNFTDNILESSSPEPLGHVEPNLASLYSQIYSIEGPGLFSKQRQLRNSEEKIHVHRQTFKKAPEPLVNFQQNLAHP